MSVANKNVIPDSEIQKVKEQFLQDIDFAYEEALARHKNIQSSSVPTWLWIALAWFASDNIYGYLASPLLYYPLLMIGFLLMGIYNLGLMPIVMDHGAPLAKQHINEILAKTPLPFRM